VSGLAGGEADVQVGEGTKGKARDFRDAQEIDEGEEEGDASERGAGSECGSAEKVR